MAYLNIPQTTIELVSPRTPHTTRYIEVSIDIDYVLRTDYVETPLGMYEATGPDHIDAIEVYTTSGTRIGDKLRLKYPDTYKSLFKLCMTACEEHYTEHGSES